MASPNSHRRVAFPLPFVRLVFRGVRPKPYPEHPTTLGEHLRKRRLQAGLLQREVAGQLGVDKETFATWEKGRCTPTVWYYPAIFSFLGYDPFPAPTTLPERIASQRRRLGLSLREAARKIGVDQGTLIRWESGEWKPRRSQDAVETFLALLAGDAVELSRNTECSPLTQSGISWSLRRMCLGFAHQLLFALQSDCGRGRRWAGDRVQMAEAFVFEKKIWWVTGASSGIGAALAVALGDAGATLILSGRNVSALGAAAARLSRPSLLLPFEASDFAKIPATVDQAWDWAAARGAGIHGLVNNAGISQRSLAVETSFSVYERVIAVDLLAPIALTQALLPRMVAAGAGDIVAVSSVAGIVGSPLRSAYSAAKHGLIGYHDSVRAETAHLGIKVLVVAPGSIRTDVSKNALGPSGEARGFSDKAIDNGMRPEDAAKTILEALRSGERELILAEGVEAQIARLRRSDPNALFDMMARLVGDGYAQQLGATSKN